MASAKRKLSKGKKKDGGRKKQKDERELDVPSRYRKRKTYGAGAKQVAWEEFDAPERLVETTFGSCIMYSVRANSEPVTLTITHNDGTTQTWRIEGTSSGEPGGTPGVRICYDDQQRPTSIYILSNR